MKTLSRFIETALEWILILLMVALTVIVVVAVVYRKLDDSLVWYDEVASIMLSWITYYGAALAALKCKHIGFDSLTWVPVQLTQSVIPVGAVLFIICELLSLPMYLRGVASGQSAEHQEIEAEVEHHLNSAGANRA